MMMMMIIIIIMIIIIMIIMMMMMMMMMMIMMMMTMMMMMTTTMMTRNALKGAIQDFYNLLTVSRTVFEHVRSCDPGAQSWHVQISCST